jgi:CheY-like chemotaxis protein
VSLRILVVEDESDIRLAVGIALRLAGHEVVEAADGTTALAFISGHVPDAMLLDLRLPDLDGWQVLDRLRHDGVFPTLPVVIGSADAEPAARRRAEREGCIGYLVKPFEPGHLLALLQRVDPGDS